MIKTKKAFIIVAICVCVLLLSTITVIANFDNITSTFAKWGLIDKNVDFSGIEIVFINKGVLNVQKSDIDLSYEKNLAAGGTFDSFKDSYTRRIQSKALYQKAIDLGYTITDDEVWESVNQAKEWSAKAENRNDMDAYIANADITWDEYWNNQFDDYKQSLLTSKYLDPVYDDYAAQLGVNPATSEDFGSQWQEYRATLGWQALEEYGVTKEYVDSMLSLYTNGIPSENELRDFVTEQKHKV